MKACWKLRLEELVGLSGEEEEEEDCGRVWTFHSIKADQMLYKTYTGWKFKSHIWFNKIEIGVKSEYWVSVPFIFSFPFTQDFLCQLVLILTLTKIFYLHQTIFGHKSRHIKSYLSAPIVGPENIISPIYEVWSRKYKKKQFVGNSSMIHPSPHGLMLI